MYWNFPNSCEQEMVGRVTVRNCVKLYTTADEIGASTLRDHCSTLISAHWVSGREGCGLPVLALVCPSMST